MSQQNKYQHQEGSEEQKNHLSLFKHHEDEHDEDIEQVDLSNAM